MEAWVTVAVALTVAVSTLGATWLQNSHSNQRFKIELGRAIDVDTRKRRWEVRGEPLLKLRAELARMAAKWEKLVGSALKFNARVRMAGESEEELWGQVRGNADDVNAYIDNGTFNQALSMQYDKELIDEGEKIQKDYRSFFYDVLSFRQLKPEEIDKAMKFYKTIRSRIPEVQELINKRLEEL